MIQGKKLQTAFSATVALAAVVLDAHQPHLAMPFPILRPFCLYVSGAIPSRLLPVFLSPLGVFAVFGAVVLELSLPVLLLDFPALVALFCSLLPALLAFRLCAVETAHMKARQGQSAIALLANLGL